MNAENAEEYNIGLSQIFEYFTKETILVDSFLQSVWFFLNIWQ